MHCTFMQSESSLEYHDTTFLALPHCLSAIFHTPSSQKVTTRVTSRQTTNNTPIFPSMKKLVFFELSVCSFIAFAKLVYPQQLLYSAKRDRKVNKDSQALVNLSAQQAKRPAQLEIKAQTASCHT